MKRDWDVIREVLLEVEALSDTERASFQYDSHPDLDGATKLRTSHAALLVAGGFLTGNLFQYAERTSPIVGAPELTWAGHDLLDTLRSKPVWEKIKTTASEKGIELTFDAVKALGKLALAALIGG